MKTIRLIDLLENEDLYEKCQSETLDNIRNFAYIITLDVIKGLKDTYVKRGKFDIYNINVHNIDRFLTRFIDIGLYLAYIDRLEDISNKRGSNIFNNIHGNKVILSRFSPRKNESFINFKLLDSSFELSYVDSSETFPMLNLSYKHTPFSESGKRYLQAFNSYIESHHLPKVSKRFDISVLLTH